MKKGIHSYKIIRKALFLILPLFFFLNNGCVEEIGFTVETVENALVVNATITNELKFQQIELSRTYAFEDDGPNPECQATVKVIGNSTEYVFMETAAGVYTSQTAFAAEPNVDYQLQIVTQNGQRFSSTVRQLTQSTAIENVYAVRETNDDGANGMSIYVDSFDPTGNSKYYRYEYEETYKIVPPSFVPEDLIVISDVTCEVKLVPRSEEERVCYNTAASQNINVTTTTGFTEDRISRYLVRFVSSDNYILTTRYSILVRQFVLSEGAYDFFETLRSFSSEGSLFSQIQPGFVTGNISAENESSEKVIGFFEVSSVASERIFFSFDDFYEGEPSPPWAVFCEKTAPLRINRLGTGCGPLIFRIKSDVIVYFKMNNGTIEGDPYIMVPRECGDCTALGTIQEPSFWVE
jgi:hypothetical protein